MEITAFVLGLIGIYGVFGLLGAFGFAMLYDGFDMGNTSDKIVGTILIILCTAFAVLFNIMWIQETIYKMPI